MAKSKGANMFSVEPRAVAASPAPSGGRGGASGPGAPPRGANLNAPDKPIRMVVSARKKLIIFEWAGDDFAEVKELSVPDKARSIAWCGDRFCVGFTKEYNMISMNSGIMTDIFPNKGLRPIATKLPNNELLLCKDSACRPPPGLAGQALALTRREPVALWPRRPARRTDPDVSIIVGYDGKPTRRFGVTWSEAPETHGANRRGGAAVALALLTPLPLASVRRALPPAQPTRFRTWSGCCPKASKCARSTPKTWCRRSSSRGPK